MALYLTLTDNKYIDMKATETQIGGNHYKSMKMQPVELFALTRCTAFQANIWKYITRYKQKNGKQDIEKAMHYAQLALELNCNGSLDITSRRHIAEFCCINELPSAISTIITYAAGDNYSGVIHVCKKLIAKEYSGQ